MMFAQAELGIRAELTENKIAVFVIENPKMWRKVQKSLIKQVLGEVQSWILSHEESEVAWNKYVELILNPLLVDENSKRILNKFLQSVQNVSVNEKRWMQYQELNQVIHNFFYDVEMEFDFEYEIDESVEISKLAKAIGMHIVQEYDNDLERLIKYCILVRDLLKIQVFIFFDLKRYFSEKEIQDFYAEAMSRKWNIILFESSQFSILEEEKYYILDRDYCFIS